MDYKRKDNTENDTTKGPRQHLQIHNVPTDDVENPHDTN